MLLRLYDKVAATPVLSSVGAGTTYQGFSSVICTEPEPLAKGCRELQLIPMREAFVP